MRSDIRGLVLPHIAIAFNATLSQGSDTIFPTKIRDADLPLLMGKYHPVFISYAPARSPLRLLLLLLPLFCSVV